MNLQDRTLIIVTNRQLEDEEACAVTERAPTLREREPSPSPPRLPRIRIATPYLIPRLYFHGIGSFGMGQLGQ